MAFPIFRGGLVIYQYDKALYELDLVGMEDMLHDSRQGGLPEHLPTGGA
jgi:hypothetical protein